MIFAGIPPITQFSGNSPFTTAPAATTQPSPKTVPSRIVTFAPIQQFLPILMPFPSTPCNLIGTFKSEKCGFLDER